MCDQLQKSGGARTLLMTKIASRSAYADPHVRVKGCLRRSYMDILCSRLSAGCGVKHASLAGSTSERRLIIGRLLRQHHTHVSC
ncbi:hypothetical protein DPX16_4547 [Anabarilius grahami]|uniref:Uncharacterized protein n=1 Tax=Anabarilius grahami TaxID=495550 RepID=A0A3N0YBT7_ANAGA|nr:hypothetical protein DPX16_4547 [Anabarilius grahami]